jgi:hypothetical protein
MLAEAGDHKIFEINNHKSHNQTTIHAQEGRYAIVYSLKFRVVIFHLQT